MNANETFFISGPPRRMQSLTLPASTLTGAELTTEEAIGSVECHCPLPARVKRRAGAASEIRLRLSRDTPPGQYQATLQANEKIFPTIIDVQAAPKLRLLPRGYQVAGVAGEPFTFALGLHNTGNVPIEIPKTAIGNAFAWQVLPAAFARALQFEPEEEHEEAVDSGLTRVERLMEELQAGYGGVLISKLRGGPAMLQPNQSATVSIESKIPSTAQAGMRYWVMIHINQFHYTFELNVTEETV